MSSSARYWREIPQRYRLEAGKCKKCQTVVFPPRLICAKCGNTEFEIFKMPRVGKLLTWTTIHTPPTKFSEQKPYLVGIVEITGGARLTTQIVDCCGKEVYAGMELKLEFRKLAQEGEAGIILYGYKAVPNEN